MCVQVQIAILMQLQGTRANPAQLERLQSMLSEKNEEIHNLVTKLQRLEKVEVTCSMTNVLYTFFVKVAYKCVCLCVCMYACTDAVKNSAVCACSVGWQG